MSNKNKKIEFKLPPDSNFIVFFVRNSKRQITFVRTAEYFKNLLMREAYDTDVDILITVKISDDKVICTAYHMANDASCDCSFPHICSFPRIGNPEDILEKLPSLFREWLNLIDYQFVNNNHEFY